MVVRFSGEAIESKVRADKELERSQKRNLKSKGGLGYVEPKLSPGYI